MGRVVKDLHLLTVRQSSKSLSGISKGRFSVNQAKGDRIVFKIGAADQVAIYDLRMRVMAPLGTPEFFRFRKLDDALNARPRMAPGCSAHVQCFKPEKCNAHW